jgi:hypothetical protein
MITRIKYTIPTPDLGNIETSAIFNNAESNLPTHANIHGLNGVGPDDHFAA